MSYILTVCGSSRPESSNARLLAAMAQHLSVPVQSSVPLSSLAMFQPDTVDLPAQVSLWRQQVREASAVIIATPEYIHNIPAQLKSALEWLTASGELFQKKVLAITYTPHHSRGAKAMISLLQCMDALDAKVLAALELSQDQIQVVEGVLEGDEDQLGVIREILSSLVS